MPFSLKLAPFYYAEIINSTITFITFQTSLVYSALSITLT